jgi:hypothetical protein
MPDDAIVLHTAAGQIKLATSKIVDPTFGEVHLLRTVGGSVASPAIVDMKRGLAIEFAIINAAAAGDNAIVAADGSGKKLKVLQYAFVVDAAVAVKWRSAANDRSGAMVFAANGGISSPFVAPAAGHLLETAAGEALNLNLSGAVGVRGHVAFVRE